MKKRRNPTSMKPKIHHKTLKNLESIQDVINEENNNNSSVLVNCLPKGYNVHTSVRTILSVLQAIIKSEIKEVQRTINMVEKYVDDFDSTEMERYISLKKGMQDLEEKQQNILSRIYKLKMQSPERILDDSFYNNFVKLNL